MHVEYETEMQRLFYGHHTLATFQLTLLLTASHSLLSDAADPPASPADSALQRPACPRCT